MNKRPLSVAIVAWMYIVTGVATVAFHATEFKTSPFPWDGILVELVSLIALVCGIFMLRGQNWARWLAIAWISFHVVLSAFHSPSELAIHSLFCAILAYFLFRPTAARYFRAAGT
jgi:hypothetical protein